MRFADKRRRYESLPLYLKRVLAFVPFPIVAGSAYRRTYRRRDHLEMATREEILAYQEKSLGRILRFAANQVPFYRQYRAAIDRYRPFEALRELPLIDKALLQERFDDFQAVTISKMAHYRVTTGGTAGNQLSFYLDDHSHFTETAFVHRYWASMGYTWRKRKATFRGIMFGNLAPGVYWQRNPIYNELQFSPFHLSEANMPAYVEALRRFAPEYLHGYPSAIDFIAEFVIRQGLTLQMPRIVAAFLTSETCTPAQRLRVEQAFRTRVFSWYGHSERVVFGGECEHTNVYHHVPDYGLLEIIDPNGGQCGEDGERGEIVGTGFWNRCLPLIRYRTGDFAVRRAPSCGCGRHWDRFDQVEGRWKQDVLAGHAGAKISVTALNMHGPLFDKVTRYQYYQEVPGVCILRIVPAPHFSEVDRLSIEAAYRSKIGDELDLQVQIVTSIPLTPRGKLRILESRLNKRQQFSPDEEANGNGRSP